MTDKAAIRQARFTRPSGATEILLIRHGESRAAVAGEPFELVDGQGDPELAEVGKVQAERVGTRLAEQEIAAVYISNLRRTAETAAPLCARHGLTPVVDADLREVHLGAWEAGVFRIKVHENAPEIVTMRTTQRWDAIPGGESNESLRDRVVRAIRRIAAQHPDQLVVAVSHGGAIGSVLAAITDASDFAFSGADNASISHIVVNGNEMSLRRFNDTGHLSQLFSGDLDLPT